LNRPPPEAGFSPALHEELQKLLDMGAVKQVPADQVRFWQRLFAVPKPGSNKVRPVLDCRLLNTYVSFQHFKQETWADLVNLIRPGDWLTRLDLTSAYLHVPMSEESSRFLGFRHNGQTYIFVSLPFGLSSAPRTFTKLMRVLVEELRTQGVRLFVYLDDILVLAGSFEQSLEFTRKVTSLLAQVGFTLARDKSQLIPTHRLVFLGLEVDADAMTLRVPQKKLDAVMAEVSALSRRPASLRIRCLSHVIGGVGSLREVITCVHLHTVHLNRIVAQAVVRQGWGGLARLTTAAREELLWLAQHCPSLNCRSMLVRQPDLWLTTDACPTGWGGVLQSSLGTCICSTNGHWSWPEAHQHINVLEARACLHAVEAFLPSCRAKTLRFMTDNQVAMYSIRKWKARKLPLLAVMLQLWELCHANGIVLQVEYKPGVDNEQADALSRTLEHEDWKLNPRLFRQAQERFACVCTVDAFASATNTQLPRFWSRNPQPGALAVDALCQDWRPELPWANAPFSMIGRMLALIQRQHCRALVVVPCWPSQPWWPVLLSLVQGDPWLLPRQRNTFLPGVTGSVLPVGFAKWYALVALLQG